MDCEIFSEYSLLSRFLLFNKFLLRFLFLPLYSSVLACFRYAYGCIVVDPHSSSSSSSSCSQVLSVQDVVAIPVLQTNRNAKEESSETTEMPVILEQCQRSITDEEILDLLAHHSCAREGKEYNTTTEF